MRRISAVGPEEGLAWGLVCTGGGDGGLRVSCHPEGVLTTYKPRPNLLGSGLGKQEEPSSPHQHTRRSQELFLSVESTQRGRVLAYPRTRWVFWSGGKHNAWIVGLNLLLHFHL